MSVLCFFGGLLLGGLVSTIFLCAVQLIPRDEDLREDDPDRHE